MLVRVFDDEVNQPALHVMQRAQQERRIEQGVHQIAEARIGCLIRRHGVRSGRRGVLRRDLLATVEGVRAQFGERFQLPGHHRRQPADRLRPADL